MSKHLQRIKAFPFKDMGFQIRLPFLTYLLVIGRGVVIWFEG